MCTQVGQVQGVGVHTGKTGAGDRCVQGGTRSGVGIHTDRTGAGGECAHRWAQVQEAGVHTGRTGAGITDSRAPASGTACWLRDGSHQAPWPVRCTQTCWLQQGSSHREDLAPAGVRTQGAVGSCPPTALPSLFWDRMCAWTPACSRLTPVGHGPLGAQVSPKENQNKCFCLLWLHPRISAGTV